MATARRLLSTAADSLTSSRRHRNPSAAGSRAYIYGSVRKKLNGLRNLGTNQELSRRLPPYLPLQAPLPNVKEFFADFQYSRYGFGSTPVKYKFE